MSGFGLSAFFFSSISHMLFPGNASDFLLVLGLGTAIPMIFGFFFIRVVPLPSHEVSAIEVEHADGYQPLATSSDLEGFLHQDPGSKASRFQSEEDSEEESREPILRYPRRHSGVSGVPISDAVKLFPSSDFRNCDKCVNLSTQVPPRENIIEGRGVDLYRWTLWKSIDFWIMCVMHSLCELFSILVPIVSTTVLKPQKWQVQG
jgi:hypothetical protein